MHFLIVQTGKSKGKRFRLAEGESVIGRDEGATIRIGSSEVSRQHCILVGGDEGVLVRDLTSRNGTFINGVPVEGEALLKPGGTITVGPMTFLLEGGVPAPKLRQRTDVVVKQDDPKLSDQDIFGWLSTGEESPSGSDTTILSSSKADLILKQRKKVFSSIAEEAADIIRRHLEQVADDEK